MHTNIPRLERCWALVDSNEDVIAPCVDLKQIPERLIQTTSPNPERWKEWAKQYYAAIVVMDLPNALDVAAVADAEGYDRRLALELMNRWSPSIRKIIRLLQGVQTEDQNLYTVESAAWVHSVAYALLSSSFAHYVYAAPRTRRAISLMSRYAESAAIASWRRGAQGPFELFEMLSTHPLTRSATGWQHELNVHTRLSSGKKGLDSFGPSGAQSTLQPSNRVLMGAVSALQDIQAGESVYWIPSASNFPGIDAVLVQGGDLYAVQATISASHSSPSEGVKKVCDKMHPDVRMGFAWHVVYITYDCPYGSLVADWPGSIKVARSHLDVTAWGCTMAERPDLKRTEQDNDPETASDDERKRAPSAGGR
ncbi:hypothetical protein OE88DRAFT_1734546 [Heliocybe sulcata]|uniref:Uncharacterized protein n=1 Tax=Heliocybe sulcata TaxID=5364 RepID=A0A5C3N689_9AGAM|nr:hypothetical protein OE88DRAFT_1734546 [Heliocybe sulcata]